MFLEKLLKLRAKSVIFRFTARKFIRPRDARSRGCRGTIAVGFVTLPPLVLAPLPLGWDERTKGPTEEHHPMTCCDFRAAAASMQLAARLTSSSCVSLQLQLYRSSDSLQYRYVY